MEGFGPRFGYHVHGTAACATVTGIIGIGLNLHFLHCIYVGGDKPGAAPGADLLGYGRAIKSELVVAILHAIDHIGIRLVPATRSIAARIPHARRIKHERVNLASIERQVLGFLRIDNCTSRGVLSIEQARSGFDRDRLRDGSNLQFEVQVQLLRHIQRHTCPPRLLETRRFRCNGVYARQEIGNCKISAVIGLSSIRLLCAFSECGDRDAGNHPAVRVGHLPANHAAKFLSVHQYHAQ